MPHAASQHAGSQGERGILQEQFLHGEDRLHLGGNGFQGLVPGYLLPFALAFLARPLVRVLYPVRVVYVLDAGKPLRAQPG
jgi:hypothetical protein